MASSAFLGRFQRAAELEAGEAYAIHDEKRLDLHAGAHCYGGAAFCTRLVHLYSKDKTGAANLGRDGRVDGVVDDEDLVGARARGLGWGPGWGPGCESWAVWQVGMHGMAWHGT